MWLCSWNYIVACSSQAPVSGYLNTGAYFHYATDSKRRTYLVWHQGGNGSSDFMIRLGFPLRPQQDKEESTDQRENKFTRNPWPFSDLPLPRWRAPHLVGTGTSVRAPNMTACCRRTNATKGFSRKSTSPTKTLDASASRGNFFMNLFFSCQDREDTVNASIWSGK